MLSSRQQKILDTIIGQYIARARPVPSQSIIVDRTLGVSSATIRNEMAHLEGEGYIIRPHTSAGSIPTDKGYRHYVESIGEIELPQAEQEQLNQLFRRVEGELNEWLNLAASLLAGMVHNTAVVSVPESSACQFKHLELVSVQESTVLLVLVLNGARVKQQVVTLDQVITQGELTVVANKLNMLYSGSTSQEVMSRDETLGPIEQKITELVLRAMEAEDEHENAEPYLDGLHFLFSQPEFVSNQQLALSLMELIEGRSLLRNIVPPEFTSKKVQVIIGRENRAEPIHEYSVVLSRYGSPLHAAGTIGVIGPTRMPYARAIATVSFLGSVLSRLVGGLYDRPSRKDAGHYHHDRN
ncbi:MAG: heat-inducible transcription repressor HrcA [Chloroflexi bacterium RBG_16_57_8]|nr:MAG: heat-inducible transcription repressor HrcA [Chloroflexi bacterium RBG_16_57_8]